MIERIRKRWRDTPVLVLSMYDESLYAERSLRAGAQGYIMKREAGDTLIEALRQVLAGEIYVSDAIRSKMLLRCTRTRAELAAESPVEQLTNRELEVFRLVGEGLRTASIADRLNLSVKTIETYYARIKDKLQIPNGRELAKQAVLWVDETRK